MLGRLGVMIGAGLCCLFSTHAAAVECADDAAASDNVPAAIIDCLKQLEAENVRLREDMQNLTQQFDRPELIPSGAVMSFDRAAGCPTGWSDYTDAYGRVVVGAIPNGRFQPAEMTHEVEDFRDYFHGIKRGQERVTLTEQQMPRHTHSLTDPGHSHELPWVGSVPETGPRDRGWGGIRGDVAGQDSALERTGISVAAAGGSQSHPNMPPYIALYYCKKD